MTIPLTASVRKYRGAMGTPDRAARTENATRRAPGAADWLLDSITDCEDPSLYHGLAGIVR